jgi:capsid protein
MTETTALQRFGGRIGRMFTTGYDAVRSSTKRKAASPILKSEDEELKNRDRHSMIGATRDLARNFAVVAWAIRKHLDYVSMFDFQSRTGDEALDAQIEGLMRDWQRPQNCDAAGRHNFPKMLRMFEAARTRDGDVFALKLQSMQLQAIEADRIRQPTGEVGINSGEWINGVRVNRAGGAAEYAIFNRVNGKQFEHSRNVPANRIIAHGYYDRFDQVRGISPLASAINSFRDVYEGIDYALAKMKVEQLFALVFQRDSDAAPGALEGDESEGYTVNFGKGPVQLDLNPGDDAKFLKSDNPGSNTQQFIEAVLGIALHSLDLPMNFHDPSRTNFFGSRAAWLLYDRSCISKRADVAEFLRKVTVWLYQSWILSGQIRLPRGRTINDLTFEWVHRGMPWWDPTKEINGAVAAINAGLDNPYRICKETGRGEYEENIDAIARAREYAESKGVPLNYVMQPVETVADDTQDRNTRGRA